MASPPPGVAPGGGPSREVVGFVLERFRSPAELDVFVHAHRAAGGLTVGDAAQRAGLRLSHAQLVLDTMVESDALVRVDERHFVNEELMAPAAALADVYVRFRRRLIESIVISDG
jgi:hypothetical protein